MSSVTKDTEATNVKAHPTGVLTAPADKHTPCDSGGEAGAPHQYALVRHGERIERILNDQHKGWMAHKKACVTYPVQKSELGKSIKGLLDSYDHIEGDIMGLGNN
jgi:hypothetical protein